MIGFETQYDLKHNKTHLIFKTHFIVIVTLSYFLFNNEKNHAPLLQKDQTHYMDFHVSIFSRSCQLSWMDGQT